MSNVDINAFRQRYADERNKRLEKNIGLGQFIELTGQYSHFGEDPNVDPGFTRDPIEDVSDAIVIGAGFGGILACARMAEAGLEKIRIVDNGGDFGGTWYWNHYPGARCDIESYIYMPMIEEVDFMPSEKYSKATEIQSLAFKLVEKYQLREHALFQTSVTSAEWSEEDQAWRIGTDRGDTLKAKYLVSATGIFPKPKLANTPGLDSFKGHMFHTSRWDYEYTGGDIDGGLTGLNDKRVAIIGTGCTAIQAVPHLAEHAQHLFVVQRTPSVVLPRDNRPTDKDWAASLEPGWREARKVNFIESIAGVSQQDEVADGWTELAGKAGPLAPVKMPDDFVITEQMLEAAELMDYQAMDEVHQRIDSIVEDRETADRLKPYFRMNCKRPTFSDDYLPAFNRSNVTLIDTDGAGVERFTEKGVVCNGQEYEVDCVIFSTGFEVGTSYESRSGFDVIGQNSRALSEKWHDGYRTLYGLMVEGFPNFFPVGIHGLGVASNFMHTIEDVALSIGRVVAETESQQAKSFSVKKDAEEHWCQVLADAEAGTEFLSACIPGYYNNQGTLESASQGLFSGSYGAGPLDYMQQTSEWRNASSLTGLSFRH